MYENYQNFETFNITDSRYYLGGSLLFHSHQDGTLSDPLPLKILPSEAQSTGKDLVGNEKVRHKREPILVGEVNLFEPLMCFMTVL